MKYLGLDIGDKRIGIAVSLSGIMASGVETYQRINLKTDCEHIMQLCKKDDVKTIVVGLPKHLDGSHHAQADKNEVLCQALREYGYSIQYFDERLTSCAAENAMLEADLSRKKRKQNIDKLAATIILQDYLDAKNGGAL